VALLRLIKLQKKNATLIKMKKVKKIVLAYSGGLDTSVILRWLQENYQAEVIAYTADLGQEIDRKKIIRNAKNLGVKNIVIEDLKDIFVKDYIFPMIRGNALYEGIYLLGTSIARPLIAKRQIQIAKKFKADAVSHGSTGKGNDQVRFELAYYYFNPKIKIIAPWRDWDFVSRSDLIKYANKNNIPVPSDKKGAPPFSVDDNLFHTSTEGKILEDPSKQAPEFIFQRTISPEKAPNKPSYITIGFKNGDPITINNKKYSPSKLLTLLNNIGGKNGVGRVDLVENRFIGIKSRGVYETPGGTILLFAHRAIESLTLDKKTAHDKDAVMSRFAELIYNGFWFSKERLKLQKIIDRKKSRVEGQIKLKIYKGNVSIVSRTSKKSIYSMKNVSFEENKSFNKRRVESFIKKNTQLLRK
jgi:argininosuccinate synthase